MPSLPPVFENAAQLEPPANLVFCGDDEGAKDTVAGLIRDVGLVDVRVLIRLRMSKLCADECQPWFRPSVAGRPSGRA